MAEDTGVTPFRDDHFVKQFDRYPEGTERFNALAKHAALLLTGIYEERAERKNTIEMVIEVLSAHDPLVKLALDLQSILDDEK